MKQCNTCKLFFDENFFNKNDYKCKKCRSEYGKKYYLEKDKAVKKKRYDENPTAKIAYQKEYYEENKETINLYRKEYYQNNKERLIEKQLERQNKRAPEIAAYNKIYRKNNKNKFKGYRKKKQQKIAYKIRSSISNSIYQALRFNGGSKNNLSFTKYIGYSVQELKQHLENLFEPWMTWKNWGIYNAKTWNDNDLTTWTWQIDHIIPQICLPYLSMEDENFKKCWALANLRPLSAKQNCLDGAYRIRIKNG